MARSRWRQKLYVISAVVLGSLAGIGAGVLLIRLIVGNWGDF